MGQRECTTKEVKPMTQEVINTSRDIIALNPLYRDSLQQMLQSGQQVMDNPVYLGALGAALTGGETEEQVAVIKEEDAPARLILSLNLLEKEYKLIKLLYIHSFALKFYMFRRPSLSQPEVTRVPSRREEEQGKHLEQEKETMKALGQEEKVAREVEMEVRKVEKGALMKAKTNTETIIVYNALGLNFSRIQWFHFPQTEDVHLLYAHSLPASTTGSGAPPLPSLRSPRSPTGGRR